MFQITFVAEIITEIQAIIVMLENTLTLPNLCNSHKSIMFVKVFIWCVTVSKMYDDEGMTIRFCAITEITVNAV